LRRQRRQRRGPGGGDEVKYTAPSIEAAGDGGRENDTAPGMKTVGYSAAQFAAAAEVAALVHDGGNDIAPTMDAVASSAACLRRRQR